ncbi:MAG: hypothetical protein HZA46_17595 [Planctomycetales bacterium]|nr:hypothetical protein [Planctomycetales bacterium]
MRFWSQPSVSLMWMSGVLWIVLSGPAYWLGGRDGWLGLSLSAVLCVVPGVFVLWLADRFSGPDSKAWAILAGTGLRLLFVASGVLAAAHLAGWGFRVIGVWAVVFYLFTLAVETRLLLKSHSG